MSSSPQLPVAGCHQQTNECGQAGHTHEPHGAHIYNLLGPLHNVLGTEGVKENKASCNLISSFSHDNLNIRNKCPKLNM